jgi:cell wall-associated NlpC family hydrolase
VSAPFFNSPARLDLLAGVLRSWLGTPFHAYARLKGVGVDCVQLAGAVYVECGHLDRFEPPRYTMDGWHHNERSAVLDWLADSPRFVRCDAAAAPPPPGCKTCGTAARPPSPVSCLPGDLVVFRLGRLAHHVGVAAGEGRFLHVMQHGTAGFAELADPTFGRRFEAAFRPVNAAPRPRAPTVNPASA